MFKRFTILVLILFGLFYSGQSQNIDRQKRVPSPVEMLNNSAQGREFYIAIPPNEIQNYTPNVLEIYVTSAKKTIVTMSNPYNGLMINKIVEPMQITVFSTAEGDIGWDWEVRESEQITTKGMKLEADQPISVYVLNAKTYTSDGYLALPITAWGKEYHHCSYYDFREVQPWGGGFIVVASEDQTKVTIRLNGVGKGQAKTLMGRNIGDIIQVELNAGQTYMVRGDATTRGIFDLSGSKIVANKNIGLISFHMRTIIPSFDIYNGRDCLSEMIPPVHAWGKKYVTVEYKRDSGMGDFFRIMASQDNTTFKCTYYDIETGEVLGRVGGQMKKAGEFLEYFEVFTRTPNKIKSIRGTSVWEADKPVLLMQYSYSEEWDQNTVFDPFMIIVVPEEQFIPNTVFQTPANKAFVTNWFNIVAKHDSTDKDFKDLKSLKIDGVPVHQLESKFTYNRIPETDLYWAKIPMQPGAHRIAGDGKVKFGGYIYGFSQWDSYGWPAAMAINKLDETDTLPPVLNKTGQCGSFFYTGTELRNGKPGDDPRQIDQGISHIELLENSFNYVLNIVTPNPFRPPVYESTFTVDVVDKTKDAYAIVSATDLYGNYTLDTISYEAVKLSLLPNELKFANVRLNTTKTLKAYIKNESDSIITVKEIRLQKNSYFKIVNGSAPPEFTIPAYASHEIEIAYTPINESMKETILDKDSIEVITECDTNSWYINGRGVIPKIVVDDWDAGAILVGEKVCMETQTGTGLRVTNTGTDTLIIYNYLNISAPFSLSSPTSPTLPFKIAPGEYSWIISPCFTAPDVNSYSIDVTIASNAGSGDSISNWEGRGIIPGPYVTSWDFGHIRQNSLREAKVFVRNKGNAPVQVTDVKLRFGNLGFSIKPGSVLPTPSVISPISLVPENSQNGTKEIELTVVFNPQSEGDLTDYVEAVFDIEEKIPDGSVYNFVMGSSYLPKIKLLGDEFLPQIVSGSTHPKTGNVTIYSTSTSAPLYVDEIRWKNPGQTEFSWISPPPSKFILGSGDSIKLPVTFHPTKVGRISEMVDVVNDANISPDSIITTTTEVIGYAYLQGVSVTDINYGNQIICNNPVMSIFVENTGSGDITIDSLVLQNGDVNDFIILGATFPIIIPSQASHEFRIQLLPSRLGNLYAEIKVYTSLPDDPISKLRANIFDANFSLSMRNFTAADELAPGMKIRPDISFKLDKPVDANIEFLQFDIIYKSKWMKYDNTIAKGSALNNSWTITGVETTIDNEYSKLTVTAKGTGAINIQSGLIASPLFMILLSDTSSFQPVISNISLGSRDLCINKTSTPGYVVLNSCVIDLRSIVTSGTQYQLFEIDPNPVTGSDITIKYSLAFNGYTRIELINSAGEIAGLLVDGEQNQGLHELEFPLNTLSNGFYIIRMTSGHYITTKSMVLKR